MNKTQKLNLFISYLTVLLKDFTDTNPRFIQYFNEFGLKYEDLATVKELKLQVPKPNITIGNAVFYKALPSLNNSIYSQFMQVFRNSLIPTPKHRVLPPGNSLPAKPKTKKRTT